MGLQLVEIVPVKTKSLKTKIDDKVRKAVENVVMTVENLLHDVVLTAMDNVVKPRLEMAVRSITELSGRGPNNVVQNHDRSDFTANAENTPLMSASSRIDMNVDQDKNDETHDFDKFGEGDFPALRPDTDRRANAHYIRTLQSF